MLSTACLVSLLVFSLLAQLLLWTWFLRIGARWAGIEGVTWPRVVRVALVVYVASLALMVACRFLVPKTQLQALAMAVAELVVSVLLACWLISKLLRASMARSFLAWLPTLIPCAGGAVLAYLVLAPFVVEAFMASSNSMAPTLLGRHLQGVCPTCGRPAYCSPLPRAGQSWAIADMAPALMICEAFHTSRTSPANEEVGAPDRFLVLKFLQPRRWDLVVFTPPEDPSTTFVKRLVGLPGEEVFIADGAVWIDGKRLSPPASIEGIFYESEMDGMLQLWGTRERPAKLGPDEYFFLGDFSLQAKDSRLWRRGAPGHPPYAVPASDLKGVVTHIFWPPRRIRVLR